MWPWSCQRRPRAPRSTRRTPRAACVIVPGDTQLVCAGRYAPRHPSPIFSAGGFNRLRRNIDSLGLVVDENDLRLEVQAQQAPSEAPPQRQKAPLANNTTPANIRGLVIDIPTTSVPADYLMLGSCPCWQSRICAPPARSATPTRSASAMNARVPPTPAPRSPAGCRVAADANRLVDRQPAEERHVQLLGHLLAAAVAEDVGDVMAVRCTRRNSCSPRRRAAGC